MKPVTLVTWSNNPETYQNVLCASVNALNLGVEMLCLGPEYSSMAEAYSTAQDLVPDGIRCFIHHDVQILDALFTKKVVNVFQQYPDTGFLGVIGNIADNQGSWWTVGAERCRGYVRQAQGATDFGIYDGPGRQLDGLFLATDKKIEFPANLPGVHFVDLWACNVARDMGYTNRIASIDMRHLSMGERWSESYISNWRQYASRWYPGTEHSDPP